MAKVAFSKLVRVLKKPQLIKVFGLAAENIGGRKLPPRYAT
jgi:hypothetical protein